MLPVTHFWQAGKTTTTIFAISPKLTLSPETKFTEELLRILKFLNIVKCPLFGPKMLGREKISFKSIFYYVACCLDLISKILASRIWWKIYRYKVYLASFGNFFIAWISPSLAPFSRLSLAQTLAIRSNLTINHIEYPFSGISDHRWWCMNPHILDKD